MTAIEQANRSLRLDPRTLEGSAPEQGIGHGPGIALAAPGRLPISFPRSRRVLVLIVGIIALSIADLAVTLTHLRTIGMVEANPIAAWLIRTTQSTWALALFKAATVGVCVALLYHLRSRVQGEIAAWVAVLILAGMSLIWHTYSASIDDPAKVRLAQTSGGDRWLFLD